MPDTRHREGEELIMDEILRTAYDRRSPQERLLAFRAKDGDEELAGKRDKSTVDGRHRLDDSAQPDDADEPVAPKRYAVNLLHQDESAWGPHLDDSGSLG